jgi:prevent-host-death family protein
MQRKGAEEARNRLPEVLDAAEKGHSTIITRRGRPVAILMPISGSGAAIGQPPLTPWQGSGRGLWERTAPAPYTSCASNGTVRVRRLAQVKPREGEGPSWGAMI